MKIRPVNLQCDSPKSRPASICITKSWKDNWGFVPMSDAESDEWPRIIGQVAIPEMLLIAEIDREAVGFSFTLPDFNEAIRPAQWPLTRFGLPIGLLRLACEPKADQDGAADWHGRVGRVSPPRRRRNAHHAVIRLRPRSTRLYRRRVSWTLEDNHSSTARSKPWAAQRYKTYRMFEKAIG